jgi:copper chaperone CopZ
MSVNGIASVDVSLEKGLAKVRLKPGNSVTLKQLQDAITRNGFTMKESRLVATGKIVPSGNGVKFQISASNDLLLLVPETASASRPNPAGPETLLVEGTVPESPKGKFPDSIRYQTLTVEK